MRCIQNNHTVLNITEINALRKNVPTLDNLKSYGKQFQKCMQDASSGPTQTPQECLT